MRYSTRIQVPSPEQGCGRVAVDGVIVGYLVPPGYSYYVPRGEALEPPDRPDWLAFSSRPGCAPDFQSESKELGYFKRRHQALIAILEHSPYPELARSVKK